MRPAAVSLAIGVTAVLALAVGAGSTYMYLTSAGPAAGGAVGPMAGGDPSAAGGGDPPAAAMQGPPPATVRVASVVEQPLQERFEVIGRLQEVRRATVAAETQGKIMEVPVDEGTRVKGGETILARIEPVWAQLEFEQAQAEVAQAQAELDQSRRDLQYLEALREGSAKPKEIEDARAAVASDEAVLAAAMARRDRAAAHVDRLAVVAPFDGVVVEKLVEHGQWVEPGDPVAELISSNRIDAVVDVPERMVNRLTVGDTIEVRIEATGSTVTGEITAIIPAGSNAARTFPVKISLSDGEGALKPGMSVVALLPLTQSTPQITVPRDAVVFSSQGATVWIAAPGASEDALPTAAPVNVEVLFSAGDRYAVRPLPNAMGATLAPQTQVVIEGAEMLFPTQPLMFVGGELAQTAEPEQGG